MAFAAPTLSPNVPSSILRGKVVIRLPDLEGLIWKGSFSSGRADEWAKRQGLVGQARRRKGPVAGSGRRVVQRHCEFLQKMRQALVDESTLTEDGGDAAAQQLPLGRREWGGPRHEVRNASEHGGGGERAESGGAGGGDRGDGRELGKVKLVSLSPN
jgi:hypothetical protein